MHILIFISLSLGYKLDSEYDFRNVTNSFQIVLFCKRKRLSLISSNWKYIQIDMSLNLLSSYIWSYSENYMILYNYKKFTRVQNKIHIDQQISLCKLSSNGKAFTSSFLFPPVIFSFHFSSTFDCKGGTWTVYLTIIIYHLFWGCNIRSQLLPFYYAINDYVSNWWKIKVLILQ